MSAIVTPDPQQTNPNCSIKSAMCSGVWEAKDTVDDLDKEIQAKFKLGYPRTSSTVGSVGSILLDYFQSVFWAA